jgi:hypothetical protein
MARRLRYQVAVSLDGFIARKDHTYDWIVMDPALGDGVPLLPPGAETTLTLTDHRVLPGSGVVVLAYRVPGGGGPAPTINYVKADL